MGRCSAAKTHEPMVRDALHSSTMWDTTVLFVSVAVRWEDGTTVWEGSWHVVLLKT